MVLLIVVISGVLLELPDTFNPLLNDISPLYNPPTVQSALPADGVRLNIDRATQIAQRYYPSAQLRWVETPQNDRAAYRVMLYQAGEPSHRFPKTTVWIDQYTGAVLASRDPRWQSGGDTFISWLHPLHNGEILGLTGRWLIFASGFVPLVLYYTGFVRWWQKKRAKIKGTPYKSQ